MLDLWLSQHNSDLMNWSQERQILKQKKKLSRCNHTLINFNKIILQIFPKFPKKCSLDNSKNASFSNLLAILMRLYYRIFLEFRKTVNPFYHCQRYNIFKKELSIFSTRTGCIPRLVQVKFGMDYLTIVLIQFENWLCWWFYELGGFFRSPFLILGSQQSALSFLKWTIYLLI